MNEEYNEEEGQERKYDVDLSLRKVEEDKEVWPEVTLL